MDINKAVNPMSEYLLKLQMIVSNTEFKNKAEAKLYETPESKLRGESYVNAVNRTDSFTSYTYPRSLMISVMTNLKYSDDKIKRYLDAPVLMPQLCKDTLQAIARKNYIDTYKESNRYYLELTGQPAEGDDIVLVPDEFYDIYAGDNSLQRNMPLHEMPYKYQELFINSDYYKETLAKYPNVTYIRYLGSYSIPLEISRPAKDGAIMKINTGKLSTYHKTFGNVTVESDLIHVFVNTYNQTRDYVYNTLRGNFSSIYENYDSFIRFLTIYLSIGNTLNELSRKASSMMYMNNVAANNYFELYGLPSSLMEGTNIIKFLKKFRLILMDKGTNTVYRVKDLIGYESTDIYSLIMVKQQKFEDGVPVYKDGKPVTRIVFRRSGVADENTSYFKFREEHKEYSIEEITSGDPRWWNGKDVEQMINEMNYTLSNSKYIQLSTHMSAEDIFWQVSILLRGLLDRKQETAYTKISINYNVDGSSSISVFDAVNVLIILMDWMLIDVQGRSIKGELYVPNGTYPPGQPACIDMLFNGLNDDGSPKELKPRLPFKITSFNFDIKSDYIFYAEMNKMEYIEPTKFKPMLEKVIQMQNNNVGEVLMTDVKNIWTYLRDKLLNATTIREYRQVTDVYSHVFLVDPMRRWYTDDDYDPDDIICKEFQLGQSEYMGFKNFFKPNVADFYVYFEELSYPISLYNVLNKDVTKLKIQDTYPFTNDDFLDKFYRTLEDIDLQDVRTSDILSTTIRLKYKEIISSKVILDTGNSDYGPTTFEALLFRSNPVLYGRLLETKKDSNAMAMLIRSIIKGLESYTNSSLGGLQFKTLGEEYFKTLKEVIGYFKSYMVEFTKDEFVYIFGGIFDNGGNSDMLKLFDEVVHARVKMTPKDSLALFDVSKWRTKLKMADNNVDMMHDEALFRLRGTYAKIKTVGYEIWYDDGTWITTTPLRELTNDSIIVANVVPAGNTYRIIINKENIIS